MSLEQQPARKPTDFVDCLVAMRNGAVAVDINNKFNELLGAVLDTGGKGDLTVKFTIEPSKRGFGGAVIEVKLEHDTKMKIPELKVGAATFFVDGEGHLTRDDPKQEALFSSGASQKERAQ